MSIVYNLACKGYVFIIGKGAPINHYGRKSEFDTALTKLKSITMVEVETDLGIGLSQLFSILYSSLCHIAQKGLISILTSST